MSKIYQQVLSLLPLLTDAEKGQLQKALSISDQFGGGSIAAPSASEEHVPNDWLLNGICVFLVKRGLLLEKGGAYSLTKRKSYKVYLEKRPGVIAYLDTIEEQLGTVTRHRPTLAFLCGNALASLLERQGYFSVTAMLSQIDRLPEAFEMAFPNYVAQGLFPYVLGELEKSLQGRIERK